MHAAAHPQGRTADEYTAKFELLADRKEFNDIALEDAYTQVLPDSIL